MQDDHIYRVIELAGTSDKTIEDAVSSAIARANKTIRNLRWFELIQTRGNIENGKIAHGENHMAGARDVERWIVDG